MRRSKDVPLLRYGPGMSGLPIVCEADMMTKTIALIVAAVVLSPVSGASAEGDTSRYAAIEKCVAQARRAWPQCWSTG